MIGSWFRRGALAAVACMATISTAQAQALNPAVADFNADMLRNCYAGENLGELLRMSNPLSLVGNVAFMDTSWQGRRTLQRHPIALPVSVTEAASPDQTTCEYKVEATTTGGLNLLGLTVEATRGDVFKIEVRLVSRQALSQVAQDGQMLHVIEADAYRDRFRRVLASHPRAERFFLVDDIAIYLLTAERYRRASTAGSAVFSFLGGNVRYAKDESFRGAKILVTGSLIPLSAPMFQQASAPTEAVVVDTAEAVAVETTAEPSLAALSQALEEGARAPR